MRTRCALLVLFLLPLLVSAQVVPVGATAEDVLSVLGQPRTRSAAKEREIWRYADYQAVFEHGRLTALVALPDAGGAVTWSKPGPPGPAADVVAGPKGRDRLVAPGGDAAGTGAMLVKREAGKLLLQSPGRAAPPPVRSESGVGRAVLVTFLLTAGLSAGLAGWFFRRQARAAKAAAASAKACQTAPADAAAPVTPAAGGPPRTTAAPFTPDLKPPTLVDWELTPELLRQMEWKRFELLVQRFYAATGLRARTHLVGADGGVEFLLYRTGATRPVCHVQCRSWGRTQVDVAQVRALFVQMAEQRVAEGAIVSTGIFSREAEAFARANRIALITGDDLMARFNRLPLMVRSRILTDVTTGDFTTPSCPRCGAKLAVRDRAPDGSALWSCRRAPQCRYTVRPPVTAPADVAAL